MPQMMPINWLISFMFFIMMFILFNILNYYIYQLKSNKNFINKNYPTKNFNWKW